MPEWLTDFFTTYVLPYWPWILAVIVGLVVLRIALKMVQRIAMRYLLVLVAGGTVGGSAVTGVPRWFQDRGIDVPSLPFM